MPPSPWDAFVAWVVGDPGAVATFFGVILAFVAAAAAASVAWRTAKMTQVSTEREQGMSRYRVAIEYMNAEPINPALALEGVRILTWLLRSSWPTHQDRFMADEALTAYSERIAREASTE